MKRRYDASIVRNTIITYFQVKSYRQSSTLCNVPKSTIYEWVQRIVRRCTHHKRSKKRVRCKYIRSLIATTVHSILVNDPYIRMSSLHVKVQLLTRVKCSLSSIRRCIHDIGFSRKSASKIKLPLHRLQARTVQIQQFLTEMEPVDLNDVVSIDETSIDSFLLPKYGYCQKGLRLPPVKSERRRCRVTLICAASIHGVQHCRCIYDSANTVEFLAFIRDLVETCPQQFVLLDNISFHKNCKVLDILHSAGKKAIFLPPYSPELNPIENIFSSIKVAFRVYNHESASEDQVSPEEVDFFILHVWKQFCPSDWTPTFVSCLKRP